MLSPHTHTQGPIGLFPPFFSLGSTLQPPCCRPNLCRVGLTLPATAGGRPKDARGTATHGGGVPPPFFLPSFCEYTHNTQHTHNIHSHHTPPTHTHTLLFVSRWCRPRGASRLARSQVGSPFRPLTTSHLFLTSSDLNSSSNNYLHSKTEIWRSWIDCVSHSGATRHPCWSSSPSVGGQRGSN